MMPWLLIAGLIAIEDSQEATSLRIMLSLLNNLTETTVFFLVKEL